MISITTPINDIVIVDTTGEILYYSCRVVSEEPLNCAVSTLRKHIANELTRMIYSEERKLNTDDLSECIGRRLHLPQKIEVILVTGRAISEACDLPV